MSGATLLLLKRVDVDTLKQPGYYWTTGLMWTNKMGYLLVHYDTYSC